MAQDRTVSAESLLQGARGVDNKSKGMRERLADKFNGGDLVTIVNSLDHDFGYVYTDPSEEDIQQPNATTRRVYFGEPKARVLKPGEQRVIPGWEAYIALVRMWKDYAQEKGEDMTIILSSSDEAEAFIQRSCKGVYDPNTASPTPGFEPEQPKRQQRQPEPKPAEQSGDQKPPVIPPTQDDSLGFDDEDPRQPQAPIVPPMTDQNQ